ncbi:hypothetical protein HK104_007008, partial [Borealophlyctis nickersoniae]
FRLAEEAGRAAAARAQRRREEEEEERRRELVSAAAVGARLQDEGLGGGGEFGVEFAEDEGEEVDAGAQVAEMFAVMRAESEELRDELAAQRWMMEERLAAQTNLIQDLVASLRMRESDARSQPLPPPPPTQLLPSPCWI